MTPQETAMKLASASATCEKHKCPFASKCKGDYSTCAMKEVALTIRSSLAEIETLEATVRGLRDMLLAVHQYTLDLEKVNKRYHDMIVAFGHGYRPKNPHKVKRVYRRHLKPKKDPVEMDGDERYAYEPPKTTEPPPPLVVI